MNDFMEFALADGVFDHVGRDSGLISLKQDV